MSDIIVLQAEKREITGKKVRSLRSSGIVPATLYEKGQESVNVAVEYVPMTKVWATAGTGQPVELTVGSKKYLTMIKDVHMDPAKNTIMHVAFHAVNANDPVEAEVPVHIEGEVPAEKLGNFIVRQNDHILVKALPANLPEFMVVDAAKLVDPGDHLTVADVKPVANVETVEEPRVQEEPEEDETAVDAADVPSDNGGEKADDSAKTE
jgi:large subunit ribosomal protein L25